MGDIIPKVGSPKDYEYLIMADGGAFDAAYTELAKVFTDGKVPNLQDGRFLEGGANARQIKGAGLPNIKGVIGMTDNIAFNNMAEASLYSASGFTDGSGAFYATTVQNRNRVIVDSSVKVVTDKSNINLDASRSNPIYGYSDTVQPKSYTVNYYICYGG